MACTRWAELGLGPWDHIPEEERSTSREEDSAKGNLFCWPKAAVKVGVRGQAQGDEGKCSLYSGWVGGDVGRVEVLRGSVGLQRLALRTVSPPSLTADDPPLVPQTKLLTQYVLSLAKYDQNYDIRDRARFTRQLIVPSEQGGVLSRHAKKLFLAPKPAPVLESSFKGGS